MHTVDQIAIGAPMDRVFQIASDVERWPEILSHYRWVRFLDRHASGGTVEMAACRPFGALRYPVWWVSEMTVDGPAREIRYRPVRGIAQRTQGGHHRGRRGHADRYGSRWLMDRARGSDLGRPGDHALRSGPVQEPNRRRDPRFPSAGPPRREACQAPRPLLPAGGDERAVRSERCRARPGA